MLHWNVLVCLKCLRGKRAGQESLLLLQDFPDVTRDMIETREVGT